MSQYDLVIRSGSVIDGTGRPALTADVAVKDGIIVEGGKVTGRGAQELSADGALVTPGFVDIHTHYDGCRCGCGCRLPNIALERCCMLLLLSCRLRGHW